MSRVSDLNIPNFFTTQGRYTEEQTAIGAVLSVRVTGSALLGPDAALKRATEVRELIDELAKSGVDEEAVTLTNVHADSKRGVFLRTSTAQYDLDIEIAELSKLVDILVLISKPKHCRLNRIRWEYGGGEDADRWIAEALSSARQRADTIAQSLGVKIEDVHEVDYGVTGLNEQSWNSYGLERSLDMLTCDMSIDCCMDASLPVESALGIGLYRTRTVGAYAKVSFTIETAARRCSGRRPEQPDAGAAQTTASASGLVG
ncbi:MAG: SIMPL domain-containing protein [Phycisphaeraceae bacterium]|nr:SIMPL domain-containing protein [Phycisphaeraceae bacterium]